MIGLLGITNCALLLAWMLTRWSQYHQQIMQGRLKQLACVRRVSDETSALVKKINRLNRAIPALQAARAVSPQASQALLITQGWQQMHWLRYLGQTIGAKSCMPITQMLLARPYQAYGIQLKRNSLGQALPNSTFEWRFPLIHFGPVPAWWPRHSIRLNGSIAGPLSFHIAWSSQ